MRSGEVLASLSSCCLLVVELGELYSERKLSDGYSPLNQFADRYGPSTICIYMYIYTGGAKIIERN